uniref:Phage-associated protein, BcepMu gp16 family n=1 Tax=Candidatus Kentrum sp. UNK TaxID=2126344 RepID=A0A451AQS4_9GAMM|nr:MAG: phage-associated protein, BcepMu gp16 family [Candidatus Kentron sp. UNK]VFK68355.1 MAG: phage-associated protein, BcepMu gp16 family [Candidatus Kentron sp. UNK]
MIKTEQEIREAFRQAGISIAAWANANGFAPNLVYDVLAGRRPAIRGQCHNIAVKLGLKKGKISNAREFDPRKVRSVESIAEP